MQNPNRVDSLTFFAVLFVCYKILFSRTFIKICLFVYTNLHFLHHRFEKKNMPLYFCIFLPFPGKGIVMDTSELGKQTWTFN